MSNLIKTLESGATLEISMAPFADGNRLLKAVTREIETVKVSFGVAGKDIKDVFNTELNDEAINTIKNIVTRLVASDIIEESLWPCMARAQYNRQKITKEIFEDETARGDYLIVVKEVLWFNLSPFLKNLGSLFSGIQPKATDVPR